MRKLISWSAVIVFLPAACAQKPDWAAKNEKLIAEPVLMAPLRREWERIQGEVRAMKHEADDLPKGKKKAALQKKISGILRALEDKIAHTTVLDPACGSGNFLYVALQLLLDLQNEVIGFSDQMGAGRFFITVSPAQLFGIEINEYAHELAQVTIWIGYIQWLVRSGYGLPQEPILRKMDNIHHMDAILAFDTEGQPVEKGQPVVLIQTDKVEYEVEAPVAGTLLKIAAKEGTELPVGSLMGVIGQPGEDVAALLGVAPPPKAAPAEAPAAPPAPATPKPLAAAPAPAPVRAPGERVKISPVAKKLAQDHGIDVNALTGTGPEGRIVREDVERAIATKGQAPSAERRMPPADTGAAAAETIPLSGMRKVIFDRMGQSWREAARVKKSLDAKRWFGYALCQ